MLPRRVLASSFLLLTTSPLSSVSLLVLTHAIGSLDPRNANTKNTSLQETNILHKFTSTHKSLNGSLGVTPTDPVVCCDGETCMAFYDYNYDSSIMFDDAATFIMQIRNHFNATAPTNQSQWDSPYPNRAFSVPPGRLWILRQNSLVVQNMPNAHLTWSDLDSLIRILATWLFDWRNTRDVPSFQFEFYPEDATNPVATGKLLFVDDLDAAPTSNIDNGTVLAS